MILQWEKYELGNLKDLGAEIRWPRNRGMEEQMGGGTEQPNRLDSVYVEPQVIGFVCLFF